MCPVITEYGRIAMPFANLLSRFRRETSGNVSLFFALSLTSILGATGVAMDYSKSSNARSTLMSATDAAALAGARTRGDMTAREAAARQSFEANLNSAGYTGDVSVEYRNIITNGNSTGYRVEATGSVRSWFGTFTGKANQSIAAAAQASTGSDDPAEIVFVLDTTDSMEGDRITNLKSATNSILDEINRKISRPGMIKVGVVPFGQYVNVGLTNRNQAWLDVRPDYQEPVVTTCSMQRVVIGEQNCRMESYPAAASTPDYTCVRDGRNRTCPGSPGYPSGTSRVCDPVYSANPQNVCTQSGGNMVRWDGCVGSRTYPLETSDSRYDVKIPGILGISCGSPIQNLTSDISSVRSTIGSLTTMGETYLPAGLIWGWRMLSPGEPLNAAATVGTGTRKFMILVTDGRNTKSPNYPMHEGTDSNLADQLTRETCSNISRERANPIQVSTIAFEMDGLEAKRILQECARLTGGQFHDAANSARLRESLGAVIESVFTVKLTH
jgi:Mg-chelatase subunit ChlD